MNKILLLTGFAVLSSVCMANAMCTPPTTLKCQCAHPIIENGLLVCGPSYCGDKQCMPDGSCCPELSEPDCETEIDTTTGCKKCKVGCDGQKDGTVCTTDNGSAGLCLNNTCQTKSCVGDEKLYVYYPNYSTYGEITYGSPALGCCINDPSTSFGGNRHGEKDGQLCCPASKPFYTYFSTEGYKSSVFNYMTCAEGPTDAVLCGPIWEKGLETCLEDAPIEYKYCPNGYSEWKESIDELGSIDYSRTCL